MPTNLSPKSQTSAIVLTSTGSTTKVAAGCPIGAYTGSADFLKGAKLQVAYVYKKLGGDVVDIELTPANVYAAYEEAVLEYSYIVNLHQSKNALSDALGDTTGTFDHRGRDITLCELGVELRMLWPQILDDIFMQTAGLAAHRDESCETIALVDIEHLRHGTDTMGRIQVGISIGKIVQPVVPILCTAGDLGPQVMFITTLTMDQLTEEALFYHTEDGHLLASIATVFQQHEGHARLFADADQFPALLYR